MRRLAIVWTLLLAAAVAVPSQARSPQVVTASGIPAVLNGIAAIDVQAVVGSPLQIPAPAGQAVLALQSTFEPPGPHVVRIDLWCAEVEGLTFYGSGQGSDGQRWHVSVSTAEIPHTVGWSTAPQPGTPCGGPRPAHPLIGVAAITP